MITNTLNTKKAIIFRLSLNFLSGKRGSNSRPQPWQGCALPTELFPQMWKFVFWAENEARTRDPNLGKVVLYQLSYFRKCEEEETRTPTSQLTLPPQSSASTNSATSPFEIKISLAWCPEQDSNLHVVKHSHLKRARLPFRHLGRESIERKTRLELATPTLARLCSTNWAISARLIDKQVLLSEMRVQRYAFLLNWQRIYLDF